MNEYYYQIYDLIIKSNIKISDLRPIESDSFDIDVFAELIDDDSVLIDSKEELTKDYFYLRVKELAVYEIKNSQSISIKYAKKSTIEEISLFLLGSCMGAILFQKGYFPLHASTVFTENGAVSFTGVSTAGKSTTLNAFLKKGYSMIADDVTAIKFFPKPLIYPSFPKTKVWQDSADKLGIDTSNLKRVHRDMDKYSLPVSKELFYSKPINPYIIYEINKHDKNEIKIETVDGLDKIKVLVENTYRPHYVEILNKNKEHFKQVSELAKFVTVKKVFRPESENSIDELLNTIEKDFFSLNNVI